MASWMETVGYIASEPGRVAVMVAMVQADRPLEEMSIAQVGGLLHQRITGQPLETARILKHIRDLADHNLIQRDDTGFRWQLTPLGILASRQWASGTLEPPGDQPLEIGDVRSWRDRLIHQMDEDAMLAEQAGIEREELLAGQGPRLAELRVLNRILGEDTLPGWLREMAGAEE